MAEKRSQKLESKEIQALAKSGITSAAGAEESYQKLQLPIKDTSEGDPSALSDARPGCESMSLDYEAGSTTCNKRSQNILSVCDNPPGAQNAARVNKTADIAELPLIRSQTGQFPKSNFFQSSGPDSQGQVSSSATSQKKAKGAKDGSLHGRWTDEEHRLFLEGMELFKKDWRSIERHIGTRTCS